MEDLTVQTTKQLQVSVAYRTKRKKRNINRKKIKNIMFSVKFEVSVTYSE